MSDQLADGTLPSDMYLMRMGSQFAFVYKHDGYFNTLAGAQFSEAYAQHRGYTLEPVVILTTTEHTALLAEVEALRAQVARLQGEAGAWETLDDIYDVDRKPNLITNAQFRGLIVQGWRLQRRLAQEGGE